MRAVLTVLIVLGFALPAYAASAAPSASPVLASVIAIESTSSQAVPDTTLVERVQMLQAKITDGPGAGTVITVQNDYVPLAVGDRFYIVSSTDPATGALSYTASEPYRIPQLLVLAAFFFGIVCVFGGWQGVRALAALAGSLFFIIVLLLPGILHGYPPVLVAVGIASLVILLGSYITHGFNKVTTSAVIGMLATLVLTGILSEAVFASMHFSGFSTDEAMTLNFATAGSIDFVGILLGGVLIGLLGVLYDAAIGQAVAVDELAKSVADHSRFNLYRRAMRIGREHIGALVNTLAIAYVGAALPLLLLLYNLSSGTPISFTLNQEIISSEIVRILIGGIGVVLAVPITTFIATLLLVGKKEATGASSAS